MSIVRLTYIQTPDCKYPKCSGKEVKGHLNNFSFDGKYNLYIYIISCLYIFQNYRFLRLFTRRLDRKHKIYHV